MNINELEQLAKAATPGPWKLSGTEHVVAGGNYVVALDCRSEDAKHIAAANPSAIIELIAAYLEAVAALEIEKSYQIANDGKCEALWILDALDTAKRLGLTNSDTIAI